MYGQVSGNCECVIQPNDTWRVKNCILHHQAKNNNDREPTSKAKARRRNYIIFQQNHDFARNHNIAHFRPETQKIHKHEKN